MFKKLILFIFFIYMSKYAFALDSADKRKRVIQIINSELKEITRMNKVARGRNPDLMMRMAELLLEKARVIREGENERYLKYPAKKRSRINKKKFFSGSKRYFIQAQKTCHVILKKFRRYKNLGEVYYILAFNEKEFGSDKKAMKFFKKSVAISKNQDVIKKSKLALAEIYYNNRKYFKCVDYYEGSLDKKSRWWTKDAFNLSWCYFRIGEKEKAVRLMNEAYDKSFQNRYVNIRNQIERDLSYFYSVIGDIGRAVRFYRKTGKSVSASLVKLSDYLVRYEKSDTALKALKQAEKFSPNDQTMAKLLTLKLPILEVFGKIDEHYKGTEVMMKLYKKGVLSKTQKEVLIYQVRKLSAQLQKKITSKIYAEHENLVVKYSDYAAKYFEMASEFSKKPHKSIYLAGETYFSAGRFSLAIPYYDRALKLSFEKKDRKMQKFAVDSLLSSLGEKSVSDKVKDKYLDGALFSFIKINPKSEKVRKVYQRLFNRYVEMKKYDKATDLILSYQKRYPREVKTHEVMMGTLIDIYRKNKNTKGIYDWVNRINKGQVVVTKGYAKKIRKLLLGMQFQKVEKASRKGDKKSALVGYVKIYNHPDSTSQAKKNSAYNLSILFYELGDKDKMWLWAARSLSLFTKEDVVKFSSTFLTIGNELFNRRDFDKSYFIYDKGLSAVCSKNKKEKNIFFKNLIISAVAKDDIKDIKVAMNKAQKCSISSKYYDESVMKLIKYLYQKRKWSDLYRALRKFRTKKSIAGEFIYYYGEYIEALKKRGRYNLAHEIEQEVLRVYNDQKRTNVAITASSLDVVSTIRITYLEKLYERVLKTRLRFPEKLFNKLLKKKLQDLENVTDEAIRIMKIGSGQGIVRAYRILHRSYKDLATQITDFTPKGKSTDYIKSFKKAMGQTAIPVREKGEEFFDEAKSQIVNQNILSKDNSYFFNSPKLKIVPSYFSLKKGIIMDKGGRQ